jgi:hypothetical protein
VSGEEARSRGPGVRGDTMSLFPAYPDSTDAEIFATLPKHEGSDFGVFREIFFIPFLLIVRVYSRTTGSGLFKMMVPFVILIRQNRIFSTVSSFSNGQG